MSKIHPKVLEYFKQVNQGWNSDGTKDSSRAKDNILDQQEVDYARKNISIFFDYDSRGFKIEAGMTIEDMITATVLKTFLKEFLEVVIKSKMIKIA